MPRKSTKTKQRRIESLAPDGFRLGIFARKTLNGASFATIEQLVQAIEAFIATYNQSASPFVWRKREVKGAQLRNTIVNLRN